MNAEPPVNHDGLKHSGSLLARAHRFFVASVAEWLGEDPTAAAHGKRDNVLVQVLTRGLQLVVIDPQAQENSQEIFETLNARGTPLTSGSWTRFLRRWRQRTTKARRILWLSSTACRA